MKVPSSRPSGKAPGVGVGGARLVRRGGVAVEEAPMEVPSSPPCWEKEGDWASSCARRLRNGETCCLGEWKRPRVGLPGDGMDTAAASPLKAGRLRSDEEEVVGSGRARADGSWVGSCSCLPPPSGS